MNHHTILDTRCIHSLAKVFADENLHEASYTQSSAMIGEYFSFQVAYRSTELVENIQLSVESMLADDISVRSVGQVPSELPNYHDHDDFLLRTTPGLYPDPLYLLESNEVNSLRNQWRALWVTVNLTANVTPGIHPIHIRFADESGKKIGSETFDLEVIAATLPEQTLIHTISKRSLRITPKICGPIIAAASTNITSPTVFSICLQCEPA